MRKLHSLCLIALISFIIISCQKGGGDNPPSGNTDLTVTVNKPSVTADNFEEVIITVKDKNNADVTATSSIRINGATYATNKFIPAAAGTYKITASKGTSSSAELTVTATSPGASPFTQKVLAEDYTGTWCGHCPRVGIQLENYSATHPNLVVVGIHGPNGSGDPYIYQYVSQLTGAFSITGWPSVILNRDTKWNENNAVLDQAATKRAPLGIALETTVAGSTINVKAKVKYDVNTDIPMKLVVLLTEDGLVHPQTNYGYYGLPDPITNYTHNHTLRTAATDIFGDAIPTASQTKGNTWEKNVSFNATGYNMSKLKVIAFVLYDTNGYARKGALNVQIVTAGQTKNFD